MFACPIALALLASLVPSDMSAADGRGQFLAEQVPMALVWHGPAAVLMFEPKSWQGRAGVYGLGSVLGYCGTVLVTSRLPMTRAQAHMSVYLGYRGILAGHGLDAVFKFGPNPRRVLAMWLASVAGQVGGYFGARGMTPGRATLVTAYADLGIVAGLFCATIADDIVFGGSTWHAAPSWGAVPGGAIGFLLGVNRQRGRDWTEGQATLIRFGGLVGAFVPAAAYYAVRGRESRRDETVMSALGMGGSIAAAALTERLVCSRPVSAGQGYAVAGAAAGGLLVGACLGFVCAHDIQVVMAGGAAGALAGFSLGLSAVVRGRSGPGNDVRIDLNIEGLAGAIVTFAAAGKIAAPRLVTLRF